MIKLSLSDTVDLILTTPLKKKFASNGGAPSRAPPPPYPYRGLAWRPAGPGQYFGDGRYPYKNHINYLSAVYAIFRTLTYFMETAGGGRRCEIRRIKYLIAVTLIWHMTTL